MLTVCMPHLLFEGPALSARVLLAAVGWTPAHVAGLPRVRRLHIHKLIRVLDDGRRSSGAVRYYRWATAEWWWRRWAIAAAANLAAIRHGRRRLSGQEWKLSSSVIVGRRQIGRGLGGIGRGIGLLVAAGLLVGRVRQWRPGRFVVVQ